MEWINLVVEIVFLVLGTVVTVYVIPWLKEKKLYDTVVKFVNAAEKWAQTNDINKKEWVVSQLERAGITVNPVVEAFIESAVQELDIALNKTK